MNSDYDRNIEEVFATLGGKTTPAQLAVLYERLATIPDMPDLAETDFFSEIRGVVGTVIEQIFELHGEEFATQFAAEMLGMAANDQCLEFAATALMSYLGNGGIAEVVFWGSLASIDSLCGFLGKAMVEWVEEGYVFLDQVRASGYINNYNDLLARWHQIEGNVSG